MNTTPRTLADTVKRIRSKNAGPFWITVDIFCGSESAYETTRAWLDLERIAECYQLPAGAIKQYDMPELHVIKLSWPRPVVQGDLGDRDMHGAQAATLLAEMPLASA